MPIILRGSVGTGCGSNTVSLSKIFEWYGDDFLPGIDVDIPGVEGNQEGALNFVIRYLPQHADYLRALRNARR